MKKAISLILLTMFIISSTACHRTDKNTDASHIETTANVETVSDTETSTAIFLSNKETVVIRAGEKEYEVTKTDFETEIPNEIIVQIIEMLSMKFGIEDYNGWEQNGQEIFIDVRSCTLLVTDYMKLKGVFNFEVDQYFYDGFLEDNGLNEESSDWRPQFTFSLKDYNNYLIDTFGPDVRQLTVNDFETVKSAKEKGLPLSGLIDESDYRCFYTGVDDIIIAQCIGTGVSPQGEYIVDIEKNGSDYIVKTVGRFDIDSTSSNYQDYQNAIKEILPNNMDEQLQTKTYKFGCTEEGDIYLKSVEKSYLQQ